MAGESAEAQAASLRGSTAPLTEVHDLVLLDLDGVVYISGRAVPGAPEAIDTLRQRGVHVAYVTNNASRTPEKVAGNLVRLGVNATADQVVTSSQAAARMLAARYPVESKILMLGAEGLATALVDEALLPVTTVDDPDVRALVTGYGPDVLWRDVMRAAVRVQQGLPWVATNADMSIPTSYGVAPGHGVMVRMLSQFTGVEPEVAGKPHRPLLDEAVRRTGGRSPLMVGDRLDTDIEGARAAGLDSLLVLTGVTDLSLLVAAPPHQRPTYLSATLDGLAEPHPEPESLGSGARCGGWTAEVADGALAVSGRGAPDDWWRAVAVAAWAHHDDTGDVPDVGSLTPPEA